MKSCDIFCNVIDNYGDIGVCWRLAKQFSREHHLNVRLWIDDLCSFAKLCPEVDIALDKQSCSGVEVCLWRKDFPEVQPALIVIEAFACQLPSNYVEAMLHVEPQPVWINLEYLSAENWIQGCHALPSPHPSLPLTKYYFFPGFTDKTGGLLIENNLLARREAFQGDIEQQRIFWESLGVEMPSNDTFKVSLFTYENAAVTDLFEVWAASPQPLMCLVPEGRILPQISTYFEDVTPVVGSEYVRGNLRLHVLPFVSQDNYDLLLWACDVNFVRGEDSFVRAQWAGRPFIWQIYPQQDEVHHAKLDAFLNLYTVQLSKSAQLVIRDLCTAWNKETNVGQFWPAFIRAQDELNSHSKIWANVLSKNNLALNLLDFCQNVGRIRAFENER